jgi:hypothetical protein
MDVDTALSEVPVNIMPLIDDGDFKTREESVAYNATGLELIWHFTTTGGATSATVVTPTTGGAYDWAHQDGGMYTIEIPASGGASINNDTEGFGWFTGKATGVLPWRGPVIGFRAAALNDALIDGGDLLDVNTTHVAGTAQTGSDIGAKTGFKLAADGLDAIVKMKALLDGTLSAQVATGADPRTATTFETDLTEASDDYHNGAFLLFYSGALAGQSRLISDYDGTDKIITVATAFSEAPAEGDDFLIIGRSE